MLAGTLISAVAAVAALTPAAFAAPAQGCASPTATASRACFPKTMTGSFSGENTFFTWQGTVSLKVRKRQTTYAYVGKANYTWKLKNPTVRDCQLTPSSGTVEEKATVSVNRTRSGRRGYSYSGDGPRGGTGNIQKVCPDGTSDSGQTGIEGVFGSPLGGYSKDLHKFAGSDPGDPYQFRWSFAGGKKACKKK